MSLIAVKRELKKIKKKYCKYVVLIAMRTLSKEWFRKLPLTKIGQNIQQEEVRGREQSSISLL